MTSGRFIPRAALAVGLFVNLAVMLWFRHGVAEVNPASRYATIDSLVHRGTYVIDDSRYVSTIDKIMYRGHYLSSKPPVLPTLMAAPYWVWVHVTGRTFDTSERATLLFLHAVGVGVPHILLMIYVYLFLAQWGLSPGARAGAFLAFALSYLGLGYTTTLNNHTVAALTLTAAFYHGYRAPQGPQAGRGHWISAGLWAGLSPTLELWSALFCVGLTVLLCRRDWRRTVTLFIPASLPWLVLHLGLTYLILDSFRPSYMRPDLYLYPGAYWLHMVGIDAVREPKPIYLFHMLLGHHGLFSMTPVFFLAMWGAWYRARRSREETWNVLAILLSLIACVALLTMKTRNYGGMCMGMRWLLFAMPLLFLFVGDWLDHVKHRAWIGLAALLVLIGSYHVTGTLREENRVWNVSPWHAWFRAHGWGSFPADDPGSADRKAGNALDPSVVESLQSDR
jgi:hypothetical protein